MELRSRTLVSRTRCSVLTLLRRAGTWSMWAPALQCIALRCTASGARGLKLSYLFHALVTSPILATSGSLIADGVRENRGAGAGWVTPWRSTNTLRAAMCG